MNLQETHILRKLDERVMSGSRGTIETQFGDVYIYPTTRGFVAEYFDANNIKHVVFDAVPSVAFLKIADQIKEMNEVSLITETVQ